MRMSRSLTMSVSCAFSWARSLPLLVSIYFTTICPLEACLFANERQNGNEREELEEVEKWETIIAVSYVSKKYFQ